MNPADDGNGSDCSDVNFRQLMDVWAEGENASAMPLIGRGWNVTARTVRTLVKSPVTSILTVLTLCTALFLLSVFLLVVENTARALRSVQKQVTMNIYLRDEAKQYEIESLAKILRSSQDVRQVVLVSKVDALHEFRGALGADGILLDGLENTNPLPASLNVYFKEGKVTAGRFESLKSELLQRPFVEQVHYNQTLLDRFSNVLEGFRLASVSGVCVMMCVTAFIIWSTIRLALYTYREELVILKLHGATRLSIAAPFILEGVLEGGLASLVALGALTVVYSVLNASILNYEELRKLGFEPGFLSESAIVLVVGSGVVLAAISSVLAVRDFLREQQDL